MNENELHLWLELLSQMTEEEKAQFLELLTQLARLLSQKQGGRRPLRPLYFAPEFSPIFSPKGFALL